MRYDSTAASYRIVVAGDKSSSAARLTRSRTLRRSSFSGSMPNALAGRRALIEPLGVDKAGGVAPKGGLIMCVQPVVGGSMTGLALDAQLMVMRRTAPAGRSSCMAADAASFDRLEMVAVAHRHARLS